MRLFPFLIGCLLFMAACKTDAVVNYKPYHGPLLEMENIQTIYSDSAIVRVILNAPIQQEMQNGNREFPKGVDVDFFEKGEKTSNLRSNYARYDKAISLYTITGNVIITNMEKNEKLYSEELKWKPEEKKIFTDKFVKIVTEDEILTGEGLTANEDFSNYKILKPVGIFSIKE